MASRSLMDNALINNLKATTLSTDNLVINNSNENEKIDQINVTTSSTNSIINELSSTVNATSSTVNATSSTVNATSSTVNTFDSKLDQINNQLISNSSFLQRTPKIINNPQALLSLCNINSTAFVNSTTYRLIGLYGFLNRHSGTYASPECAGVWNTEQLLQENIKLTTFADLTPESTITWTRSGPNINYNYYSDATLRTFGLFSRLLAYEDAMGATQDGALAYSYYNPSTTKLHLLLPNIVADEFVPGSFFIKRDSQIKLAKKNVDLKPCVITDDNFVKLYNEFDKQLNILSDEAGLIMTPDNGGTPLSIPKTKLEWLFWGHAWNIKSNYNLTLEIESNGGEIDENKQVLWEQMNLWWSDPANNNLKTTYLNHTDINDYIPYLSLDIAFYLHGPHHSIDNTDPDAYKTFKYPFDWTVFGYLELFYANIWNIVSLNTAMNAYCVEQLSDLVDVDSAVAIANGDDPIHTSATGYSINIKNTGLRDVLSSMIPLE